MRGLARSHCRPSRSGSALTANAWLSWPAPNRMAAGDVPMA
ncbi:Uncharacterised protein [Bordetella pertussis]|nr:Uncharacterised protein [Bordetella pertussis]